MTFNVEVHYHAPLLTVGGDLTLDVGQQTTLAVTAGDPNAINSVQWWFSYEGEDYELETDLTQLSQSYTFEHYGDYDVWIQVTDIHGETASADFHVTVNDTAPSASAFSVSGPIDQGTTATFTGTMIDADALEVVNLYVDWTDSGDYDLVTDATVNPDGSFSFTHLYPLPDTYTVKLRLDDEAGNTADYQTSLVVNSVTLGGSFATDCTYSWNEAGVRTYLLEDGDTVYFENVTAPDPNRVEYHFVFTDTVGGAQTTIVTNEGWAEVPTYASGKKYGVEAWIENLVATQDDPDATTNLETTHVNSQVICGTYQIPIWGRLGMSDPEIPPDGRLSTFGIADNTARQVTFTVDPQYRKIWPNDVPVHIYLTVTVRDASSGWFGFSNPTYEVISTTDYEGTYSGSDASYTFSLPGYGSDRVIDVAARIFIDGSNSQNLGTRAPVAGNPGSFPSQFTYGGSGSNPVELTGGSWACFYPYGGASGASPIHNVRLVTSHTPSLTEQLSQGVQLVTNLINQFGQNASALISAVRNNAGQLLQNLWNGLTSGFSQAISELTTPSTAIGRLVTWLTGGQTYATLAPLIANPSLDNVKAFFLEYAGLTWDHLRSVIQQQLGAGNYAAAERLITLLGNVDSNTPDAMITFLQNLPSRVQQLATDLGTNFDSILDNFTWQGLANQLWPVALRELTNTLLSMAPRILAKFDPTAGTLMSIYDGCMWLINNQQQILDFFQGVVNAMGSLADSVNNNDQTLVATFATGVKNAITGPGVDMLLNFAASQLGLGGFRQSLRNVLNFIPNQVDSLMRRVVSAVASRVTALLPGGGSSGLYGGLVGTVRTFTYRDQSYNLWAAKPRTGAPQIKIAQGTQLIKVLSANDFSETVRPGSRARFNAVVAAANTVASANTPQLAGQRVTGVLTPSETALVQDITQNACTTLNTGCFAAGTKLWTPIGYVPIEQIRAGEPVYARSDFDPNGPIEERMVEETFTRNAPILHLHIGGHVIRTTGEHPFFAYQKGWTKAATLQIGDRLLTSDGSWQPVEDLLETGEWEPVYNLRVAEHHTYFVGDWGWGFTVWAHNTYETFKAALRDACVAAGTIGGGINGAWAKQVYDLTPPNSNPSWTRFNTELQGKQLSAAVLRDLWWNARDQAGMWVQTQNRARQILQPFVQDITSALQAAGITDAVFGIRGSLASGYKINRTTGQIERPWDSNSFDIDAYVVSAQLAALIPGTPMATGGVFISLANLVSAPGFRPGQAQNSVAVSVRQKIQQAQTALNTEFGSRLKDDRFSFRVWSSTPSGATLSL